MRTEKLFTIICVLLAFNVTESFGAASIRTTAVGASGSTTTASRAGALRTESVRNTNNLSSSVSVTPSTSAESGGRMASLPGGMPKVSKPNLPSAAYTANIDLSGIEARLDDLQTNKANVDDLDNFATRTELSGKADLSDLEDYATKDELEDKADASALTGLATKAELNAKADISRVYDKETVDAKLDGLGVVDADTVSSIVDGKLSPYSTTTQMNTAITSATSGLATTSALNTGLAGKANAGDVYTKTEVDTKLTTKADASALNAKLDSPSGGSAGQVLKLTSNGVAWGTVDAPSPNVQLTTFNGDSKLYYCTKTSGTCDTNDSTDNWTGVELSAIQGQDGQDGKDACQNFDFEEDTTYTGPGTKFLIYCND